MHTLRAMAALSCFFIECTSGGFPFIILNKLELIITSLIPENNNSASPIPGLLSVLSVF